MSKISELILNSLRHGDAVVLDADSLLLRHGTDERGEEVLSLPDKNLPALLRQLHETGHPVILYTAHQETLTRLEKSGLKQETYTLLHAPEHPGRILAEHIRTHADTFKNIKRFHLASGQSGQLDEIENVLSTDANYRGMKRLRHHLQQSTQLLTDADRPKTFPETLDAISTPLELGGGTKSTFSVTEDKQDKPYVLKLGDNEAQIKIETLMNILYKRLGVAVPDIQAYRSIPHALAASLHLQHGARTVQLSEYLDAADRQDEEAIIRQACRDFIIHAFMGNIDITKTDNFIQTKDSRVVLIDAGANFLFRALGESRDEESHAVNEMQDMRDPEKNFSGAQWFRELTDRDIQDQVEELINKSRLIEETIWNVSQQLELPSSLQQQLIAGFSHRLDDLAEHYGFATQPFAKRDKAAIPHKTAAGVLHLQRNEEGELCVLLSRRVRHDWCDNFGGKSDDGDKTLANTARREVSEESSGVLQYSDRELARAAFHDIITVDERGHHFLYRMYFVTADHPVDITRLQDPEHTSHHLVPLVNLQAALQQDEKIQEEGKSTIAVKDRDGKDVIIFPPLYNMLRQEPVRTLVDAYANDDPVIKKTGTQGLASGVHEKKSYRPLASPQKVRADIIATQLHKAEMLNEIRQRQDSFRKNESTEGLSQSEYHLQSIMGNDFVDNAPVEENIKTFLDKYYRKKLSEEEKGKLIEQTASMIYTEKAHPEWVFFYHGVSSEIAYAYEVYTALYRILAADNTLDVLRADNALFHKCLDIQSFITHFQGLSEGGQINNYTTGYMECALSTNLFVFGSHNNLSSDTINYYITDSTAASINLKKMLEASLKSMGVSDRIINHLAGLENDYPQKNHGSLYQIGLPVDEVVDHHAYLAGTQGVLNPLPGAEDKTTRVSRLLASLHNQENIPQEYMSQLQARVMPPPGTSIMLSHYHWGQGDHDKQKSFDQRLGKLAGDMAYDILLHRNQFNRLNSKSALMRYLPDMLQQAGIIMDENNVSDELVVQLVEAEDFENIKTIVEAHPEYRNKTLTSTSRSYSNRTHQAQKQATLLERCLAVRNSGASIRAIFGNNFYEGKLDSLPFHQVVGALPANERYKFIVTHPDKIESNNLALVLVLVPGNEYVDLVKIFADKVKDYGQLSSVLCALPKDARVAFANIHAGKIQNGNELSIVLIALPENAQADFATTHADKIQNGDELLSVLDALPGNARAAFANTHADKIQNGDELSHVLYELPGNARTDFATTHADKIQNGNELSSVLYALPGNARADFATTHADKIQNGNELSHVLRALPENARAAFANIYLNKSQTPQSTPEPSAKELSRSMSASGIIKNTDKNKTIPEKEEHEAQSQQKSKPERK